jgi:putative DNA primase/helicase
MEDYLINRTSKMSFEVINDKFLNQILGNIPKLDFTLLYHVGTNKEAKVRALLKELKETPSEENSAIVEQLKKLSPKSHIKTAILTECLAQEAEKLGIDLGVDNDYPYYFNGKYWRVLDIDLGLAFFSQVFIRAGYNKYESLNIKLLESFYEQFSFACKIPKIEQDSSVVKINLQNGTFHISEKEQELKDFNSLDFFKYQLPFDYNPQAVAPKFRKFLDEVLPGKNEQLLLFEYLGYVLTKHLKLEKCLVLVGTGSNGKSVLYDIISALLGNDNISTFSMSKLCETNGYNRAELTNKLLNYSSEIGSRGHDADTIKKLISGEPIDARSPYGKPIELRDYCKFMFNANSIPKNIEQSHAYYRRFIYLTFDVTIPEEKKDPELAKKIIGSELSGIFNLIIDGLKRILVSKSFTHSAKAQLALMNIQRESDSVALFIEEEGYEKSIDKFIALKDLYNAYKEFCREDNYIPVSRREFSRRLEEVLGITLKRKATNNATWVYCMKTSKSGDIDRYIEETFKKRS